MSKEPIQPPLKKSYTTSEKRLKRAPRKRQVIAVFSDDDKLDFIGIYLSTNHMEDDLGIYNGNIGHYLKYRINTLSGYLPVIVSVGKEPLNVAKIEKVARAQAQERALKNALLRFNAEDISNLTPEQAKRIREILEESAKSNSVKTNTQIRANKKSYHPLSPPFTKPANK